MAAAALLALPIGVAAAIGFEGSVSGLTGGLGSLASGPDTTTERAERDRDASLDTAVAAIAGGPGDRGSGSGWGDAAGSDGGGGESGGGSAPVTGVVQQAPQGAAPGDTGGGGGQGQWPLGLPGGGGGAGGGGATNPVSQLLEGVNNGVTGLLGGGQ